MQSTTHVQSYFLLYTGTEDKFVMGIFKDSALIYLLRVCSFRGKVYFETHQRETKVLCLEYCTIISQNPKWNEFASFITGTKILVETTADTQVFDTTQPLLTTLYMYIVSFINEQDEKYSCISDS